MKLQFCKVDFQFVNDNLETTKKNYYYIQLTALFNFVINTS